MSKTNLFKDTDKKIEIHNLVEYGLNTLENMGNTCYLNTTIQLLSNCILKLSTYFLNGEFKHDFDASNPKKQYEMCRQYYKILVGLWEDPKEKVIPVRPTSFKKVFDWFNPQFKGWGQHDCQESLSALIDLLHTGLSYGVEVEPCGEVKNETDKLAIQAIKEWGSFYGKEYSKLIELLYGQDHTTLRCLSCGNVQHKFEPYNIITLPVLDKAESTIEECFDEYTKDEKLVDSVYTCEKCGEKGNMSKQITLWRTPEYLIISFKRFSATLRKKNTFIKYPIEGFNINKYISGYSNTSFYDLVGVGNHSGGLGGGHYFAFCKHADDNWYCLNDSRKLTIKIKEAVVRQSAYVLVYKRRE